MSNFNWCHGPSCHTYQTQSRVRGSKGNKVLRTIKIGLGNSYRTNYPEYYMWQYFCNQSCLMAYIREHLQAIVAIAPRREPLETPIKVEKEKYESYRYDWNSDDNGGTIRVPYTATKTTIKSVDND